MPATTPPSSARTLMHKRQGKVVGIYCDQPAKILEIETQDDPRLVHQAMPEPTSRWSMATGLRSRTC